MIGRGCDIAMSWKSRRLETARSERKLAVHNERLQRSFHDVCSRLAPTLENLAEKLPSRNLGGAPSPNLATVPSNPLLPPFHHDDMVSMASLHLRNLRVPGRARLLHTNHQQPHASPNPRRPARFNSPDRTPPSRTPRPDCP